LVFLRVLGQIEFSTVSVQDADRAVDLVGPVGPDMDLDFAHGLASFRISRAPQALTEALMMRAEPLIGEIRVWCPSVQRTR
jgi:hypothetical protein